MTDTSLAAPHGRRLSDLLPRSMWVPTGLMAALFLIPAIGPLFIPWDPEQIDIMNRLSGPSWAHPLGQDEFGRDRLARTLYGGRVSLAVAFIATTIACISGTAFGMIGAYFRGPLEFLTTRLADIVLCFPPILLALLVVTLFGPGSVTLVCVLSVLYFPAFARIAFGETIRVSALDFVEASRAIGTSSGRIVRRTILPNIAGPVAIQYSLTAAAAITIESGLSFLGLGVVPPAPSWGQMIRGARAFLERDPLGMLVPCIALTLTIWAINHFCDRLRDTLDPRSDMAPPGKLRKIAQTLGLSGAAPAPAAMDGDTVARVSGLRIETGPPEAPVSLIEDVSLELKANQVTALVGESGSGKSLSALALMGLLPETLRVADGSIELRSGGDVSDLRRISAQDLRQLRGSAVAMIFQEPMTSLNPVHRIGYQLTEAIEAHCNVSAAEARGIGIATLRRVGINDAEKRFDGYPHEMSGGMRQRVMIAMALLNAPRLLIADEPTTALDVTIQAEIMDLLGDLQNDPENRLSMLLISHNLGVVAGIADRVAVMYSGMIVEEGPVAELLGNPRHPYTRALIEAMPAAHHDLHSARGDRLAAVPGTPPLPARRPDGCTFRARCPHAAEACKAGRPPLERDGNRAVRCVRWMQIEADRMAAPLPAPARGAR